MAAHSAYLDGSKHSTLCRPLSRQRLGIDRFYASVDDKFASNSYLNIDVRAAFFAVAYSSSPGMAANMIGLGAKYPAALWDADGERLTGERTYRLHLLPNPPARLFWAVTLYNPEYGTMVDNGQPFPSINFMNTITQNADGSYDLYFGPSLPQGTPESNWIKTNQEAQGCEESRPEIIHRVTTPRLAAARTSRSPTAPCDFSEFDYAFCVFVMQYCNFLGNFTY